MNERGSHGVAVFQHLTLHTLQESVLEPAVSLRATVVLTCVLFFFCYPDKSRVMPIRRAAAAPTQEKAPAAAAEEGEAGVELKTPERSIIPGKHSSPSRHLKASQDGCVVSPS